MAQLQNILFRNHRQIGTDIQGSAHAFRDRSTWEHGHPAHRESQDRIQWVDPQTGYDCLLHRNGFGTWCGYVGVSKDHSLHGLTYWDLGDLSIYLSVHGGITYTEECTAIQPDGSGICHPTDGEDHIWWIGFDCNHSGDNAPLESVRFGPGVDAYKSSAYAIEQTHSLAEQVAELASA